MYRKVLIASDGSDESLNAAETAVKLGLTADAEVVLLSALDVSGISFQGLSVLNDEEMARIKDACKERNLQAIETALRGLGVTKLSNLVVENTPAAAISETALSENADLIVVGRRGIGALRAFFLGSVSLKVLELCERPVIVVPKDFTANGPVKRIVVPTDFSESAMIGILHAAKLAVTLGATLTLVHDLPDPDKLPDEVTEVVNEALEGQSVTETLGQRCLASLEAIAAPLREDGLVVHCKVLATGVAQSIVETSDEIGSQLIVMSSHGRGGLEKLFVGSFAVNVVKQSHVPVLVVMKT
ncbi:MAG: universal stress protein [Planctomycetota bacterium]|nr:universal stress protein [Planctomycetota bacterium]